MKFIITLIILTGIQSCFKKNVNNSNSVTYPSFLSQTILDTSLTITKGPDKESRAGYGQTIKSIKKFRFLCNSYNQNEYYPYWLYNLGINLQNCNFDSLAFFELNKLSAIDTVSVFPNDLKRVNNLNDLKDLPLSIQFKLSAKLNNTSSFQKLKEYNPKNNYSMLQYAYGYMYQKNYSKTFEYLKKSNLPENHLRLEKRSSTTVAAVALSYALENFNLIDTLSSWTVNLDSYTPLPEYSRMDKNNKPNDYSFNQWQSSFSIISKFKELSQKAIAGKKFIFSNLKNGEYLGSCRGFIDSISVKITVIDNQLSGIQIIKCNDDRPQSAIIAIPERILNQKSIKIDAVTSATITSSAIIAAICEANIKAQ